MKIVLLAPSDVEEYYTASLLLRGFQAVTIPPDVPSLDFTLRLWKKNVRRWLTVDRRDDG